MVTGWVIVGRSGSGVMVQTLLVASQLVSLLGMLKAMVSAPEVALACWMAARSVHCSPAVPASESQILSVVFASPVSPVELTVKVAAWAGFVASTPIEAATSRARSQKAKVLLAVHIAAISAAMPLTLPARS